MSPQKFEIQPIFIKDDSQLTIGILLLVQPITKKWGSTLVNFFVKFSIYLLNNQCEAHDLDWTHNSKILKYKLYYKSTCEAYKLSLAFDPKF